MSIPRPILIKAYNNLVNVERNIQTLYPKISPPHHAGLIYDNKYKSLLYNNGYLLINYINNDLYGVEYKVQNISTKSHSLCKIFDNNYLYDQQYITDNINHNKYRSSHIFTNINQITSNNYELDQSVMNNYMNRNNLMTSPYDMKKIFEITKLEIDIMRNFVFVESIFRYYKSFYILGCIFVFTEPDEGIPLDQYILFSSKRGFIHKYIIVWLLKQILIILHELSFFKIGHGIIHSKKFYVQEKDYKLKIRNIGVSIMETYNYDLLYIPPECSKGRPTNNYKNPSLITNKKDVWCAGIILSEMICGLSNIQYNINLKERIQQYKQLHSAKENTNVIVDDDLHVTLLNMLLLDENKRPTITILLSLKIFQSNNFIFNNIEKELQSCQNQLNHSYPPPNNDIQPNNDINCQIESSNDTNLTLSNDIDHINIMNGNIIIDEEIIIPSENYINEIKTDKEESVIDEEQRAVISENRKLSSCNTEINNENSEINKGNSEINNKNTEISEDDSGDDIDKVIFSEETRIQYLEHQLKYNYKYQIFSDLKDESEIIIFEHLKMVNNQRLMIYSPGEIKPGRRSTSFYEGIFEILQLQTQLVGFYPLNHNFGIKGTSLLADTIHHLKNLDTIKLTGNEIDDNCIEYLAPKLEGLISLHTLNIVNKYKSYHKITDIGLNILITHLRKLPNIKYLNLANNLFGYQSLLRVTELHELSSLLIGGNPNIDDDVIVLLYNASYYLPKFSWIFLDKTNITIKGIKYIIEQKKQFPQFTFIDIHNNENLVNCYNSTNDTIFNDTIFNEIPHDPLDPSFHRYE